MCLRVGINAQLLSLTSDYRNAGVGQYIYQLLRSLAPHDDEAYHVFLPAHASEAALSQQRGFTYVRTRLPTAKPELRILWEQCALPALLLRHGLDVLHCPVNVLPMASPVRAIVTIHDLSFVFHPEGFPPAKRRYHWWLTRLSARCASMILADSASTRRDLITHFGAAPHRVRVVYPGVTAVYGPRPDEEVAAFRKRQGLDAPYILHVGTLQPRKNLERLVEAFDAFKRRSGLPHVLALVGGKGWMYDDLLSVVRERRLEGDVIFPGFAAAEDVPLWYAGAEQVVYPSLYEGFGFPVVEAMACGTPVVASSASSIGEVAGDAALLVSPYDVEGMASAIGQFAHSAELRREYRERGFAQAAKFTWAATAEGVQRAYHDVAASHQPLRTSPRFAKREVEP